MRERLVSPDLLTRSVEKNPGLAGVVGQVAAIDRLREYAALYYKGGKPPGHVLLVGDEGLGKGTLGRAFAAEFCRRCVEAESRAIKQTADLIRTLTGLTQGDALLIKDLAMCSKTVAEVLAVALKDSTIDFVVDKGMFAKTIKVPLQRFTCLGTASTKAKCPGILLEAFPLVLSLQSYSNAELVNICARLGNEKGISITPAAAAHLVAASGATPHAVDVLVCRLADLGKRAVSVEDIVQLSSALGLTTVPGASSPSSNIETLSGVDFEKAIASLLRSMGFRTEVTKASGDGGIDIVATLDRPIIGGRYLIQCKRFGPDNLVGAATVREFYGALTADRSAIKGILIATSGFTPQALAFARELPIELIGGDQLRRLLAQLGASAGALSPQASAPPTLFEGEN